MRLTITLPNKAVLRLGPFHLKWSPATLEQVVMAWVVSLAIYLLLFVWYANTAIARTYPTDHVSFWFGLLHGYFVVPSFVLSWFNNITIYQSPNSGFWYNLGFLIGIGALLGAARSED